MGCFLFEGFYEHHQIAFAGGGGDENVQMIGHEAIGVDEESPRDGIPLKVRDEPGGYARVGAETAAGFKAEREEIEFSTEVIVCREADVFALEDGGHGCGFNVAPRASARQVFGSMVFIKQLN